MRKTCPARLILLGLMGSALWRGLFPAAPDIHFPQEAENSSEIILKLLKSRDSAIKAVLGDGEGPYSARQKDELMRLINDIMDFSALSETALSGHWQQLDESRRQAFVSAFSQLVKLSSVKKLDIFHAVIEYNQVQVEEPTARVKTRATWKRTRTRVDYILHCKDGGWFITDFSIDGVSTADSYRRSFRKILRKHGFSGLMNRLRKRLSEEGG